MTEAELAKCFAFLDAVRRDGANVDAVGVDFSSKSSTLIEL
jgi:hypothetical protein